jgi:hypothetical protein
VFHAQLSTQHYDAVAIKPCCWDGPVSIHSPLVQKGKGRHFPFRMLLPFSSNILEIDLCARSKQTVFDLTHRLQARGIIFVFHDSPFEIHYITS